MKARDVKIGMTLGGREVVNIEPYLVDGVRIYMKGSMLSLCLGLDEYVKDPDLSS